MVEQQQPFEMHTQFTRSNFCRVVHIDGAWGAITPQLNIHMALFNERWALADGTTVKFDEEGSGILRDYPNDPARIVTREIEVDVFLNLDAAIFLRNWLNGKIVELQGPPALPAEDQAGV